MKDKLEIGRLAFREEGDLWVAYYAPPDTMVGAIVLGSIRMNIVAMSPTIKSEFMEFMKRIVAAAVEMHAGIQPTWKGPRSAPESERSRKA